MMKKVQSLEQLKAATMACRECPIGEFATQSVIGEGNPKARLMLVGEQPGDQEDLQGHPFVGPVACWARRWRKRACRRTNASSPMR
jgi:uracil-DNA glycosylase